MIVWASNSEMGWEKVKVRTVLFWEVVKAKRKNK